MREFGSNEDFFRLSFLSSTIRARSENSDTFGEKMDGKYRTACIRCWTTSKNPAGCGSSVMESDKVRWRKRWSR